MNSKKSWRQVVLMTVAAVLVAYIFSAISPLPAYVGRDSPRLAAWLSPLTFNFEETYTDGHVLVFSINQNRNETAQNLFLLDRSSAVSLHNGCSNILPRKPYFFEFESFQELWDWGQQENLWCFNLNGRHTYLELHFEDDRLIDIRVVRVNNEAI